MGPNGTSGHSCLTPVCLFLPDCPSYRCTWRWLRSHLSQWGAQAFECLFVSSILLKQGTPLLLQSWIQLIRWSILSPKRNLTQGNDLGHWTGPDRFLSWILAPIETKDNADDTGHRLGETETDQVEAGWGPPCLRPRQCWNVCIVQRFCLGDLPLTGAALQILPCLDFPKLLRHLKKPPEARSLAKIGFYV